MSEKMLANWKLECDCCGQVPTIEGLEMCAVCTFGEAEAQQELIECEVSESPFDKPVKKTNPKKRRAKKGKGKTLDKRKEDFKNLKPFSHSVIAFNDHYQLRVTAPNGEVFDYYPVSEKYHKKGSRLYLKGLGNLIDYLNEVS